MDVSMKLAEDEIRGLTLFRTSCELNRHILYFTTNPKSFGFYESLACGSTNAHVVHNVMQWFPTGQFREIISYKEIIAQLINFAPFAYFN